MKTKETSKYPFRRGVIETSSGKKTVNYRFINDNEVEMYDDNFKFLGITKYLLLG